MSNNTYRDLLICLCNSCGHIVATNDTYFARTQICPRCMGDNCLIIPIGNTDLLKDIKQMMQKIIEKEKENV